MVKIYTLKTCDSCRKATKWLDANNIPFQEIPIREKPPKITELRLALKCLDGNIRKLFNTSGQDYRSQNLNETLPTLAEGDALQLLTSNGNLIKRPFLVSDSTVLVGFQADTWRRILSAKPE